MTIRGAGFGLFGCRIVEEIGTLAHHFYELTAAKLEVNLRIFLQDERVTGVGEFDGFVDVAVEYRSANF